MVPKGRANVRAELAGRAWRGRRRARDADDGFVTEPHFEARRRRQAARAAGAVRRPLQPGDAVLEIADRHRAGAYRLGLRVRAVQGRTASRSRRAWSPICATSTRSWRSASRKGSASTLPKAAKPARAKVEMPPSPALSIQRNAKATLEGRKIGVLIADGSDAKALKTLKQSAEKEGATLFVVGPPRSRREALGRLRGEGRRPVAGLALAAVRRGGARVSTRIRRKALSREGAAVKWVMDAFAHLKAIGADAAAKPLLDKAGVEKDDGRLRSRRRRSSRPPRRGNGRASRRCGCWPKHVRRLAVASRRRAGRPAH